MMYEIANIDKFRKELDEAESNYTKNSNFIKIARSIRIFDFETSVISKLINTIGHPANFMRHIRSLNSKGLIANDDYSIAIIAVR